MNKKLLVSLMLVSPVIFAQETPYPSNLRGVHIVPLEQISVPAEFKQKIRIDFSKDNNYENKDSYSAKFLMKIKEHAKDQFDHADRYAKYGDGDTSMKHSLKEIKLAIPFKPIKGVDEKDIIGYAAGNSFVENKGWNGIRVFFSNENLGNCSYQYIKIISVMLPKESTEYLVNNKPGDKHIEGNQNTGFNYNVTWYDNDAEHSLDCANKSFKPDIMRYMIKLANVIDKG